MEKEFGAKEHTKKYSMTQNIILPIGLSLILSLSNYYCDNKKDNEWIQKKDKIEKIDTKKIDKIRDKWIEEIEKNKLSEWLKTFFLLEKIYLEIHDDKELQDIYRLIGIIFLRQEKTEEAIKYFEKSLEIAKKYNNKRRIIFLYACIGETYQKSWKDSIAISTFLQWRNVANKIENPNTKEIESKVIIGTDIARRYLKKANNTELAKQYRKECIKLNQKINNINNTIILQYDIGDYNMYVKKEKEVLKYYREWLRLAKEHKLKSQQKRWYNKLYHRYKKNNNPAEALKYKELEDSLKYEIINEESIQQINELNIKYETEKKDNEIKLQNATIEKQAEQKKKILWTAIGALIAALGASRGTITALKSKNKEKKHKIELQNINKELVRKNKNITDSIHYAKRIQENFLQNPEELKKLFPESFMLFKPKDIVSGDFYRFKETKSGKKIIAAVDCTGHGVPGAFLTFIGNNILNDSIEEGKENPGEILDYLSENINKQLKKKDNFQGDAIKDAMDIAIFSYNPKTNEFESAGAYNTIYIFKKGQMQKIKGDKLAIGSEEKTQYTNQKLTIEPGSTVYLWTDGFADQFWGPNGKKMMKKRMTRLLEDLQKMYVMPGEEQKRFLTMEEQKEKIEAFFNEWKGDNEQTDDILLIGIKV